MGIGAKPCPLPFARRFRIVVRKYLYFQRGVSEELGPAYLGCPVECTAPNADPRRGCPKCLYQIKYKAFEAACKKAFKKHSTGYEEEKEWPIDRLVYYMTLTMRANGQHSKGYDRKWSVILSRLVDIYRDESNRMSAIDSFNHRQQMKTLMEELRGAGGSRTQDDEDYGDD